MKALPRQLPHFRRLSLCLDGASPPLFASELPFRRGVNLTSWFQSSGPRQIQFTKFTRQDLVNIRSLGCDVIRLPINLHAMTGGPPEYTLDPLFLEFLDPVVDWAEELQIHLILDNHSFDPAGDTDPNVGAGAHPSLDPDGPALSGSVEVRLL